MFQYTRLIGFPTCTKAEGCEGLSDMLIDRALSQRAAIERGWEQPKVTTALNHAKHELLEHHIKSSPIESAYSEDNAVGPSALP